jgi:hypothetical protein
MLQQNLKSIILMVTLQMMGRYKCLVSIYIFSEMKLRGLFISKTEL